MSIKLSDVFNSSEFNINNIKLDDVLNKTKDVVESVSKKNAQRIDLSRKKIECFDAKSKLTKLYEALGKLKYGEFIGESVDEQELQDTLLKITELKSKIDVLSADIEYAREQFNEQMANMAQKTKEAFEKISTTEFNSHDMNTEENEAKDSNSQE